MGAACGCCSTPVDFDGDVDLFHFSLHRAVGKGAFGKVRVVTHRRSNKVYALKYVDKAKCTKQRVVANVIQERRLLEEVEHPFIVNMHYAFQDDENCFFVLDLMLGGDLRFHLERNPAITEDAVRFWTAELASAINYLHKQKIVHRDLKPDNILLDSAGHAHITDFNIAIHYSEMRLHTSIAGSMGYMAPEVLARKGYSWHVDYWSLGVCVWELLFRRRPFDGRTSDKLTSSILKDPIRFPDNVNKLCSPEAQQFLRSLLDRNIKTRLACTSRERGLNEFRNHPWLSSLNWDLLLAKQLQPPFVPDMNKANFDVSHELDEFMLIERPLTHSSRKKNVDPDKLRPEYRQLEEQFTLYDSTKGRRMSYYPHNFPLVPSGANDTIIVLPSATDTTVQTHTVFDQTSAVTPDPSVNDHSDRRPS